MSGFEHGIVCVLSREYIAVLDAGEYWDKLSSCSYRVFALLPAGPCSFSVDKLVEYTLGPSCLQCKLWDKLGTLYKMSPL